MHDIFILITGFTQARFDLLTNIFLSLEIKFLQNKQLAEK